MFKGFIDICTYCILIEIQMDLPMGKQFRSLQCCPEKHYALIQGAVYGSLYSHRLYNPETWC